MQRKGRSRLTGTHLPGNIDNCLLGQESQQYCVYQEVPDDLAVDLVLQVGLVTFVAENLLQDVYLARAQRDELSHEIEVAGEVQRRLLESNQGAQVELDFHAWADSALYLTHDRAGLRLTIEQRAAPAPEPLYVKLADRPPHPVITSAENDSRPSLQDRIVDSLQRSPDPISRTTLRRLLGVHDDLPVLLPCRVWPRRGAVGS